MSSEGDFTPFGASHLLILVAAAAIGFLLIRIARTGSRQTRDEIAVLLGGFMIVEEVADFGARTWILGEPVVENLPFHLCNITLYATALALLFKRRWLFELTFLLGIGGAVMPLLTPGEIFPFPHLLFFTFFFSHSLIIIGLVYMVVCWSWRPYPRTFGRTFLAGNLVLLAMIPVNVVLGTNYLFMCEKPPGGTFLDLMGPWPFYILILEVVGALVCCIVYLPFLIRDIAAGHPWAWPLIEKRAARHPGWNEKRFNPRLPPRP
jgi:hypothetical integral membrane protein (TIGR02206 family)